MDDGRSAIGRHGQGVAIEGTCQFLRGLDPPKRIQLHFPHDVMLNEYAAQRYLSIDDFIPNLWGKHGCVQSDQAELNGGSIGGFAEQDFATINRRLPFGFKHFYIDRTTVEGFHGHGHVFMMGKQFGEVPRQLLLRFSRKTTERIGCRIKDSNEPMKQIERRNQGREP